MVTGGSADVGDGGTEHATATPRPDPRIPGPSIPPTDRPQGIRKKRVQPGIAMRPPTRRAASGPTPTVAPQPPRPTIATLSDTTAKSRFGVAYFRAVCAQANVGFNETPIDEDVLAIDGIIPFAEATVSVQIKCTSQFSLRGSTTATWPADVTWREKWKKNKLPVYFVLVIVERDQTIWLDHSVRSHTLCRAAAFWARVDPLSEAQAITVPRSQRLTVDTFFGWWADALACFGQGSQ